MTITFPQPEGMDTRNWHEWHLTHPYIKKQWHEHMTPAEYQAALKHGFAGWVDKTQAEHDAIIAKKKFGTAASDLHTKVFNEAATRAYADAVKQALTGTTAIQLKWQSTNKGNALAKKDIAAGNTMDYAEHIGAAHGYALAAKHLKQIVEPGKGPIGQHALPAEAPSTVTPENLPGLDDAGLKAIIDNPSNDAALIAKAQEILTAREASKAAQEAAQAAQDGGHATDAPDALTSVHIPASAPGGPHPEPVPAAPATGGGMPHTQAHLDAMTKISGPLGSNGGQWYKDEQGNRFLVKPGKSDQHIYNEVAVNAVYKAAGVPVKDTGVVTGSDGKVKVVGKAIDPLTKWHGTPEEQKKAREDFGLDALLSNYDALGLVDDNAHFDSEGRLVRVDNGGGGFYRAQGAPKASFHVGAWDEAGANPEYKSLRDPNINGQHRFYDASPGHHDEEINQSLAKAASVDLAKVKEQMTEAGVPEDFQTKFLAVLADRQAHLKQLPEVKAILDAHAPSVDVPADVEALTPHNEIAAEAAMEGEAFDEHGNLKPEHVTGHVPISVSPAPQNVTPKSQVKVGDKVSFKHPTMMGATVGSPESPVTVTGNWSTSLAWHDAEGNSGQTPLGPQYPVNVHVPSGTLQDGTPGIASTLKPGDMISFTTADGQSVGAASYSPPVKVIGYNPSTQTLKYKVTGHEGIAEVSLSPDAPIHTYPKESTPGGTAQDADVDKAIADAQQVKVGPITMTMADAKKLSEKMHSDHSNGVPNHSLNWYSTTTGIKDAVTGQNLAAANGGAWNFGIPDTNPDSEKSFLNALDLMIDNPPPPATASEDGNIHVGKVVLTPSDAVKLKHELEQNMDAEGDPNYTIHTHAGNVGVKDQATGLTPESHHWQDDIPSIHNDADHNFYDELVKQMGAAPNIPALDQTTTQTKWGSVVVGDTLKVNDDGVLHTKVVTGIDPPVPENLTQTFHFADGTSGTYYKSEFTAKVNDAPVASVSKAGDPKNIKVGLVELTPEDAVKLKDYMTADGGLKGNPHSTTEIYAKKLGIKDQATGDWPKSKHWWSHIEKSGKGDSDKQFLQALNKAIKFAAVPSGTETVTPSVSPAPDMPVYQSQVMAKNLKPGDTIHGVMSYSKDTVGSPDSPVTVVSVGEKDSEGDVPVVLNNGISDNITYFTKPGTKFIVHNATTGPVYDPIAAQAAADAAQALKEAATKVEHASPQAMRAYYEDHPPEVGSKTVGEASGVGKQAELEAYAKGRKWAEDHPEVAGDHAQVKKFATAHNKAVNANNFTTAANMRGIVDKWNADHQPDNPSGLPPLKQVPHPASYPDWTDEQRATFDKAAADQDTAIKERVPTVEQNFKNSPTKHESSMAKMIQNQYMGVHSYVANKWDKPAADIQSSDIARMGRAWALRRRGAMVPKVHPEKGTEPSLSSVSNGHVIEPPKPGEKIGTVIKTITQSGGKWSGKKKVKVQSDAGVTISEFTGQTPMSSILAYHQKHAVPALPALKLPPVPDYQKSVELAAPVKADDHFDNYMHYKEAKYPHYVQGYLEGKADAEKGGAAAEAYKAQAYKVYTESPNSHAGVRAKGQYDGARQAIADKEREDSLIATTEKNYTGEDKYNPPPVDPTYVPVEAEPKTLSASKLTGQGFHEGQPHPMVSFTNYQGEQVGTPEHPVELLSLKKASYSQWAYTIKDPSSPDGESSGQTYGSHDVLWTNPPPLPQQDVAQYKVGYALGKEEAKNAQSAAGALDTAHDKLKTAADEAKFGTVKKAKALGKLHGFESAQKSIEDFKQLVSGTEKKDYHWGGDTNAWSPTAEAYAKGYIATKAAHINPAESSDEHLLTVKNEAQQEMDAASGDYVTRSLAQGKLNAIEQIQRERAERASLLAAGNKAEADGDEHFAAPAAESDEYKIAYAKAKGAGIGQTAEENEGLIAQEQAKADAAPDGSKEKAVALGVAHGTAQSNEQVKKAEGYAAEFAGLPTFKPDNMYNQANKVPYILGFKEAFDAADEPGADLEFLKSKYDKLYYDNPGGSALEAVGRGGQAAIQQAIKDKAERDKYLSLAEANVDDPFWHPPAEHTDDYKISYVKGNQAALSNDTAGAEGLVTSAQEELAKHDAGTEKYVKALGKLHGAQQGAEEVKGAEAIAAEFAGEDNFTTASYEPSQKVPYIIGYKKAHDEATKPGLTDQQLADLESKYSSAVSNAGYGVSADKTMAQAGRSAVRQIRADKAKREHYLAQAELAKNDEKFAPPTEHSDDYKIGYVKGKTAAYNENAQAQFKALADQKLAEATPGSAEYAAALGTVHGAEQGIKNTAAVDEFKADEFYAPPAGVKVFYNGGYAEGRQATSKMSDEDAIKYKNDAYEVWVGATDETASQEANGRMDGAFQTLADRGLAGSSSSLSTDFGEKFQKAGKLTNKGLKEIIPQKYLTTEPALMKLDAYRVGKNNGAIAAKEMTPQELEDHRDTALMKSQGAISASDQGAWLGHSHAYEAALAEAKPSTSTEAAAPVEEAGPVDPKTLPEYEAAKAEAAAKVATGVTSKDLYQQAQDFDKEASPQEHAQHLAYQEAAEALDQAENEKPEVNIIPGSAPEMSPEALELMKGKALPAKDPNYIKPIGQNSPAPIDDTLAVWAYDQGRVLGLDAAQTATDEALGDQKATASDIEAQALVHEDLAAASVGLEQRKQQGIAKMLHRYANWMVNGGEKPSTSKDIVPKPNVQPAPKHVVAPSVTSSLSTAQATKSTVSGYPDIEVSFTSTEKAAIGSWTTAYRWAGSGNSTLVKAINLMMAGKNPKDEGVPEDGIKKAKIILDICNRKSVPSKTTIYRKTAGVEFAPGQIDTMIQHLAEGKEVTLSEPLASHSYSSGMWHGDHQYIIEPGAMTCDLGPFGNHPGEVETVTGGLFQVTKVTKEGGMTKIYMKQLEHYAN